MTPPRKIEVWPVIHVLDREQTLRCAAVAEVCGATGVFLISMHGDDDEVDEIAPHVRRQAHDLRIGVNYLTQPGPDAIFRSLRLGYDATWTDRQEFTGGELTPAAKCMAAFNRPTSHLIFAAVAFKGQPADPLPAASARIAAHHGMIPTTSGTATGVAPDLVKLVRIRHGLRPDDPLAIASGVTPENALSFAIYVSHVLVSTGISRTFHEFDEGKLRALVAVLHARESI